MNTNNSYTSLIIGIIFIGVGLTLDRYASSGSITSSHEAHGDNGVMKEGGANVHNVHFQTAKVKMKRALKKNNCLEDVKAELEKHKQHIIQNEWNELFSKRAQLGMSTINDTWKNKEKELKRNLDEGIKEIMSRDVKPYIISLPPHKVTEEKQKMLPKWKNLLQSFK
jgi:hypothetical protein